MSEKKIKLKEPYKCPRNLKRGKDGLCRRENEREHLLKFQSGGLEDYFDIDSEFDAWFEENRHGITEDLENNGKNPKELTIDEKENIMRKYFDKYDLWQGYEEFFRDDAMTDFRELLEEANIKDGDSIDVEAGRVDWRGNSGYNKTVMYDKDNIGKFFSETFGALDPRGGVHATVNAIGDGIIEGSSASHDVPMGTTVRIMKFDENKWTEKVKKEFEKKIGKKYRFNKSYNQIDKINGEDVDREDLENLRTILQETVYGIMKDEDDGRINEISDTLIDYYMV